MNKLSNFVSLSSEINEIPFEYSHLIQVQNLSARMILLTKGTYLFERAFALVDISNEITKKLIDKNILIVIDTPTQTSQKKDLNPTPKRKSKAQMSKEAKLIVNELGKLFQNG